VLSLLTLRSKWVFTSSDTVSLNPLKPKQVFSFSGDALGVASLNTSRHCP